MVWQVFVEAPAASRVDVVSVMSMASRLTTDTPLGGSVRSTLDDPLCVLVALSRGVRVNTAAGDEPSSVLAAGELTKAGLRSRVFQIYMGDLSQY